MNEYIVVFFAALLFFSLPKILGYIIKGIGVKEVNFIFEDKSKELTSGTNRMIIDKSQNSSHRLVRSNLSKGKLRKQK